MKTPEKCNIKQDEKKKKQPQINLQFSVQIPAASMDRLKRKLAGYLPISRAFVTSLSGISSYLVIIAGPKSKIQYFPTTCHFLKIDFCTWSVWDELFFTTASKMPCFAFW